MTYILLDTNIYLHCQAFDTLPLKEIAGATDEVAVLLPMQVLRELEEKKDDKRPWTVVDLVAILLKIFKNLATELFLI